jgi:hypothetical protein
MGIEVPERALYLRTLWAELGRIHSHIFWLGVAADAFGYESVFMQSLRLRELVLDIIEETTGGRVIFETYLIDQRSLGTGGPSDPKYYLRHNELLRLFKDLRILFYREGVFRERLRLS